MDANQFFSRRARAVTTVLFLLVIWTVPSRAAAQAGVTPAEQRVPRDQIQSMVDELKQLVTEQRALIDGQAKRIGALEQDLASIKRQQASGSTAPPALTPPQADQTAQRQPEMPRQVVAAGEFPGSIGIPGTDAAIKFTGQGRMTMVQTLGPLGTDDRFVTSSIPVGDDQEAGEDARTVYSASASRFGLDLRTPFRATTLRTFIEGDFAGDNNTFRLRHAFMQTSRWIVGQTWSTFSDPEAEPIGIDFEGLNAISLFRQTQIRYTYPLRPQLQLAVALENPAPDLTGASGVNLTPTSSRACDGSRSQRWLDRCG